jgi:hypothetical protein
MLDRSLSGSQNGSAESINCIVICCDIVLKAHLIDDYDIIVDLNTTYLQALMCYRASHLNLLRLRFTPAPICEPASVHIMYRMTNTAILPVPPPSVPAFVFLTKNTGADFPTTNSSRLPSACGSLCSGLGSDVNGHNLLVELSELDLCFSFLQV